MVLLSSTARPPLCNWNDYFTEDSMRGAALGVSIGYIFTGTIALLIPNHIMRLNNFRVLFLTLYFASFGRLFYFLNKGCSIFGQGKRKQFPLNDEFGICVQKLMEQELSDKEVFFEKERICLITEDSLECCYLNK